VSVGRVMDFNMGIEILQKPDKPKKQGI